MQSEFEDDDEPTQVAVTTKKSRERLTTVILRLFTVWSSLYASFIVTVKYYITWTQQTSEFLPDPVVWLFSELALYLILIQQRFWRFCAKLQICLKSADVWEGSVPGSGCLTDLIELPGCSHGRERRVGSGARILFQISKPCLRQSNSDTLRLTLRD